jgi:hypothetical protein
MKILSPILLATVSVDLEILGFLALAESDGSEVQIIMKQYKQVPGLWCNLFSLTAALNDGWILSTFFSSEKVKRH